MEKRNQKYNEHDPNMGKSKTAMTVELRTKRGVSH